MYIMARERLLLDMYQAMLSRLGPSNWWPGDSPFEIAVGAILTQNTNWGNVEKAIANLKEHNALSPQGLRGLLDQPASVADSPFHSLLAELIRPAGYYNIKAKRLGAFLRWLQDTADDDMESLQHHDLYSLRESILSVKGVGPETADAILLYAANHPTFVVDAYTHRMLHRHAMVEEEISYEELRNIFMHSLDADVSLFNEYHALIVRVGKEWCHKKNPNCADCPLGPFLEGEVA